jgi:hypothetical protein
VRISRGAVVTASIGGPSGKPRPFLVLCFDHFAAHSLVAITRVVAVYLGVHPAALRCYTVEYCTPYRPPRSGRAWVGW